MNVHIVMSILFLFTLLGGYYLEFLTGIPMHYYVLLGIGGLLYAFLSKTHYVPNSIVWVFFFVVLFIVSFSFFHSFKNIIFYFSPLIAYLFFLVIQKAGVERFFSAFFLLSLLILVLGCFEYISGKYLYVSKSSGIELDEELFSGSYSFLRVKSVFEGPLTLAQFSFYGLAFMYLRGTNLIKYFPYVLIAFLTVSRMAIGISLVFLSLKLFTLKKIRLDSIVMIPLVLLFIGFLVYSFLPGEAIHRTLDVFNFSSSDTNLTRLYYWTQAVYLYLSYDFLNALFGYNGYYNFHFENNAESGWLTILVDNGLIGLLSYLSPIFFLLYQSFKRKRFDVFFVVSSVFIVNSTMTLYLGLMSGIFYWLLIFYMFYLLKNKERCNENRNNS